MVLFPRKSHFEYWELHILLGDTTQFITELALKKTAMDAKIYKVTENVT
jgi:hypothetical protein